MSVVVSIFQLAKKEVLKTRREKIMTIAQYGERIPLDYNRFSGYFENEKTSKIG